MKVKQDIVGIHPLHISQFKVFCTGLRKVKKTIENIVRDSRNVLSSIDTYYLLAHVLRKTREFLFTHPEYKPSWYELIRWRRVLRRRMNGEPAAYITGVKEFYSLSFHVSRQTLIPRPETELLVDEIIRLHPGSFLDIGTGCGCIAVSAGYHLRQCRITAVDISRKALCIAKRNARALLEPSSITFIRSNYFENLPAEKYDIIVCNPPYVKREKLIELGRERMDYEPLVALDGGSNGLDAYRVLLAGGRQFLKAKGVIVLEISPELKSAVLNLAQKNGYRVVKIEKDLSGSDRMIVLTV